MVFVKVQAILQGQTWVETLSGRHMKKTEETSGDSFVRSTCDQSRAAEVLCLGRVARLVSAMQHSWAALQTSGWGLNQASAVF